MLRSTLKSAIRGVGGLYGGAPGASLAGQGADWLARVTGMGDYKVSSNSIFSATTGVPSFSGSSHSIRVKHREFLGDILSSTQFQISKYPIQPGDPTTFPWLSQVAIAFQEYSIKGLIFQFHSTSANALNSVNTALGTVVMATQYNPARPAFISKPEMEQYEFSCSSKPSCDLLHPIECMPKETPLRQLYIRTGDLPDGEVPQFYDFGAFYIATVGMQAEATIGELWVTYDIEFYKPRLLPAIQREPSFYLAEYVTNSASLFGTRLEAHGNVAITTTATSLTLPAGSEGDFLMTIITNGDSNWNASSIEPYLFTYSNLFQPPDYIEFDKYAPGSSATSAIWARQWVLRVVNPSQPVVFNFSRWPIIDNGKSRLAFSFL